MALSPTAVMASSAWSDTWYPTTMQMLTQIAGGGPVDDNTGVQLPNLSAIDTMALLGLVTGAVASAIVGFNQQANGAPKEMCAVRSDCVDSEGRKVGGPTPTPYIDAKTYLTYQTDVQSIGLVSETAWKRYPPNESTTDPVESYEVWTAGGFLAQGELADKLAILQFVRQLISDWQRMVMSCTSALSANSADVTVAAPVDDLVEFLSALRAVCSDLDVLKENPVELAKLQDALKYALAKTSEFVGKAAAEVSNEVGKDAGIIGANVTEGFLSNAGILSFVVVGILVHLFLA